MTLTVAMGLSGLEPEQWNDDLKDIYRQGAILFSNGPFKSPKSPGSLSLASSSGASSYYSMESGISSMSPDSDSYQNNIEHLLSTVKYKIETCDKNDLDEVKKDCPVKVDQDDVIYQNRNLLDLGSNIRGGWKYQTTILSPDFERYFDSRSQYSRLFGVSHPQCTKATCKDEDCSFQMPIYF